NVDGKSMDVKGTERGQCLRHSPHSITPSNGTVRTVSWTTINDFGGEKYRTSIGRKKEYNKPHAAYFLFVVNID
ncbi:hypothetical protein ACM5Q6_28280, partial [Klebsiella pneumoniae subsp. pneumoniae]